jgi:tetratricopeptide (TPR) repeat protein
MGEYARAEPLLRQALEIAKEALGEGHPEYARGLNNLAVLYQGMGDFARAEPLFRQAMEIKKKVLGEGHPDYAQGLNNLAELYQDMRDYARAEPLIRQALEIKKKVLGEGHPDYAQSLNNLAGLYWAMGEYARAEPLLRQALEIKKKVLGEGHPDYAASLNNLAAVYQDMDDYARAEPLYRQALEIRKKAVGEGHPDYATGLNNLAALYRDMGEYARAEPLFRQALEITKKALGEDHPSYAGWLRNLAMLYLAMGDDARAGERLAEVLDRRDSFTRATFAVLGERQRLRFLAEQGRELGAFISVSLRSTLRAGDLYRHVLRWKGAAEARQVEDRLARDRPELRPTLTRLAGDRARLARLAFATPPEAGRQDWRRQFDALRERIEGLESDLAAQSAAFGQQRQGRGPGPDEVAAALPEDVALVDLLVYAHVNPPEGGKGPFREELRLLAFVLRRGRPVAVVPLGAARPVDEAVDAWRRALAGRRPGDVQAAAATLGRLAWEPLREHLGDARTVLVAPDGALARVPLAALPGRRPGSYLIEDLALGYVASGLRPSRPWPRRRGHPAAASWPSATSPSGPTRVGPPRPTGPRSPPHPPSSPSSGPASAPCPGPDPRPCWPATCSARPSLVSRPTC